MQNDKSTNDKVLEKYISVLQEKLSVSVLRIAELEAIVMVLQESNTTEGPSESTDV